MLISYLPFVKAHSLDPLSLKGMDILAVILANEKRSVELEALALKLISVSDSSFESWVKLLFFKISNYPCSRINFTLLN